MPGKEKKEALTAAVEKLNTPSLLTRQWRKPTGWLNKHN